MKKRNIIASLLLACALGAQAQTATVPYGFAPNDIAEADKSMLGLGDKSGFVKAAVCLDPATDPVLQRLKGQKILGVRVLLQHRYRNGKNQTRNYVMAATGTPDNMVAQKVTTLEAGWNDVCFDEPLTIGDEPIYVGAQVYETLSDNRPFVAYGQASVPGACWFKLKDDDWKSFTDRGTLCIAALLDSAVATPQLERTAYVQNTTHPQTVAPSTDFEGGLYIHNFTTAPITSLTVAMQGQGDHEPTMRDITLSSPVPAYGSVNITTTLRSGHEGSTEATWSAWATTINGTAAQDARRSQTTLAVSQDDFIRVPLVEEFTSMPCPNCPYMAYYLEKGLELWRESGRQIIYLGHRCGYRYDDFTCDNDKAIEYLFNGDSYNPAVTFNRTQYEGQTGIMFGSYFDSGEMFVSAFETAADQFAQAEVFVEPTRSNDGQVSLRVHGRVASDYVSKEVYISAFLVEDSIPVSARYPQEGYDEPDGPADLKDVFKHNGVIRGTYNKEAIGDRLTVNEDGTFDVTYSGISLTNEEVEKNMRVVALLHRVNKANIADNFVLNAAEARWQTTNGISVPPVTTKKAEEAIYDLQGRRVSNPTHGLYIVGGKKVVIK